MTTMTRTDVHAPKNLVTEDYEFVFCEVNYLEDVPGWVLRRGDWGMEMARWIGRTDKLGRSTNQCHHCGTRINYFAVLKHIPTGDAIVVGETCLENRFERATAEFHKLRKQAQLDRERQRIRKAREAFVEQNPDLAWLNGDEDDVPESIRWSDFVWDLRSKFRRYADLSDKQVAALRRTIEKSNRPKAPEPTWIDVPVEGRHEVTGKVLARKTYENDFGITRKMLVQVGPDSGAWKLWTTVPRHLNPDRGDEITIRVTVKRSDDDSTFARGSRPTEVKS